jgi:hypothetical protein
MEDLSDDELAGDDDPIDDDEAKEPVDAAAPAAAASSASNHKANVRLPSRVHFDSWKTNNLKYKFLTLLEVKDDSDTVFFRVVCETCKVR